MSITSVKNSPSNNYQRLTTHKAGADLTDKEWSFVEMGADGVELADNGSDVVIGILHIGNKSDNNVSVLSEYGARSMVRVKKGNVLAVGDQITSDVNGEARKVVNGDKLFHGVVVDTGITAADNPNDNTHAGRLINIQLQPNTPTNPAAKA